MTRNKVIYTVERKNDQPNEFFKVMKPETADASAGCIPFNSNVFLLAKSALEMNCYLLIFSFSVLPQTVANIYYHNCTDCHGFYHLTKWFTPFRLVGYIFPPAIVMYRIKKKKTFLI